MKQAVLLCAGRGSRMGSLTDERPKPLISINGTSIRENTVQQLISANYTSIVIVVGYKADMIKQTLRRFEEEIQIIYIFNEQWESTNNIYSLWLTKEHLKGEFTLLEADIYFNSSVLQALSELPAENNYVLVSPLNSLMEGTFVEVNESGIICKFNSTKSPKFYHSENQLKTLNIYRFNSDFANLLTNMLEEEIEIGNTQIYYEEIFKKLVTHENVTYHSVVVPADTWYEMDNRYDLSIGEFQFSEKRHDLLKKQHGGYWRYPITDYALIYNFHFPPQELKRRMQQRFDDLLLNYPSCSSYIENHLAEFLQFPSERLVLANGVSEIIKILPQIISGPIVLIEPSFNEYANCFESRAKKFLVREEEDFEINFQRLIEFVHEQKAEAIVIVSPDNPTGKLHSKRDLLKLYKETEELQLNIIIDESFIDFSSKAEEESFLHNLINYPRLTVLKSMSKTFGIGGLRLGYAASYNTDFLNDLSNAIPIWNINGFAEEFILNLPAYNESYKESCLKVREDTDELFNQLSKINGLKVFTTESNFILCKILDSNLTADQLASWLLEKFNIYIKECSGKTMYQSELYFRVSSRTQQENKYLVNAISTCLSKALKEHQTKELVQI